MEVKLTDEIRNTWERFDWTDSWSEEQTKWLAENIKGNWAFWGMSGFIGSTIWIENKHEAMLYRLRWM